MNTHWKTGLALGLGLGAVLAPTAVADPVRDATITAKVETAFLYNEHLNPYEIRTRTENGTVTLIGTVQNQAQKDIAERLAKSIDGVKRIVNELQVASSSAATPDLSPRSDNEASASPSSPTQARSAPERSAEPAAEPVPSPGGVVQDATTTAAVVMRLQYQEGVPADSLRLSNRNGRITVEGEVSTPEQRRQVLEIIGSTRGVTDVVDQMTVTSRDETYAARSAGGERSQSYTDYDFDRPAQSETASRQGYPRPESEQPHTWDEVAREHQQWADQLRQDVEEQRTASRSQADARRRADDSEARPLQRRESEERVTERREARVRDNRETVERNRHDSQLQEAQAEYRRAQREAERLREQADGIREDARNTARKQRARLEARLEGLDDDRANRIESRMEQEFRELRRDADRRADELEEQADRLERQARRRLAQAQRVSQERADADRSAQARTRDNDTRQEGAENWRERASDRLDTAAENLRNQTSGFRAEASETAQQVKRSASDEWLEKRLEVDLMLSRDVSIWDLDVEVQDGTAHLTGQVDTDAERQAAERIAQNLDGIRGVRNDIRVGGDE